MAIILDVKTIKSVALAKLRNGEDVDFQRKVLEYFTKELAELHKIGWMREEYVRLYDKLDVAYRQNQGFITTAQLEAADGTRDTLFTYLKQMVEVNKNSPVAANKAAAEALSFVIKPYSGASGKTYRENTIELMNLTKELCKEENVVHIETLGLGVALEQLISANDAFDALHAQRSDEKDTRSDVDKIKEIRPEVDAAYRTCVDTINAIYYVNEVVTKDAAVSASLSELIHHINGLIIDVEETLTARLSRAENAKEEATEGGPGEETASEA